MLLLLITEEPVNKVAKKSHSTCNQCVNTYFTAVKTTLSKLKDKILFNF